MNGSSAKNWLVLNTNLRAVFFLCQAAGRPMIQRQAGADGALALQLGAQGPELFLPGVGDKEPGSGSGEQAGGGAADAAAGPGDQGALAVKVELWLYHFPYFSTRTLQLMACASMFSYSQARSQTTAILREASLVAHW